MESSGISVRPVGSLIVFPTLSSKSPGTVQRLAKTQIRKVRVNVCASIVGRPSRPTYAISNEVTGDSVLVSVGRKGYRGFSRRSGLVSPVSDAGTASIQVSYRFTIRIVTEKTAGSRTLNFYAPTVI